MQEHPHLPKRERQKGWLPAILLSGAVHGVLFLGLFTVFQWQTRAEFVYAELWAPEDVSGGNDPTGVAERVEAPEPIPEEPQPEPQPEEPQPEETPPEEPARLEETLARLEEERKAEAERLAEEARKAEEAKRLEEERLAEEARKAEEARAQEEARLAEEARKAEEAARAEEERLARERAEAERIAREAEAERRKHEKLSVSVHDGVSLRMVDGPGRSPVSRTHRV